MAFYDRRDPLDGKIPSCVYNRATGLLYYTSGRKYLCLDPKLHLKMYDARICSHDTKNMEEVLPDLFVSWNGHPRNLDLHAIDQENRRIRRLIDDQEILDRLRDRDKRKLMSRFLSVRDLPKSDELSGRSPGSDDALRGPSRAGNFSRTPGLGGSYSGPSRAVSPPLFGRASSFQRSDTQRTPNYREKWNFWQSPPDHSARPTQRASSPQDLKSPPRFADANGVEFFNAMKSGHATHGSHHRDPFSAVHDRLRDLHDKEPGHNYDHMDDSIVAWGTIPRGCDWTFNTENRLVLKPKGLTPLQEEWSWTFPVYFCGLDYTSVEVFFPLDDETIAGLANDALRVLHIRLAAVHKDFPNNPGNASDADMAQSRRVVLAELKRRGFVRRTHLVLFSGLPAADSAPTAASGSKTSAPLPPSAPAFQPAPRACEPRPKPRSWQFSSELDALTTQYEPWGVKKNGATKSKGEGKARAFELQLRHPNGSDTESLPPRREPKLDIPVLTPETLSIRSESPSSASEGARAPKFEEIVDREGPVKGDKA